MGIRFDKDSRRATNGPVIFFSDASSQEAFSEEINGAIISGLSFYSYRMPGDVMISFGSSEGFIAGISQPGFVIGMFDLQLPILTIPYKGCKNNFGSGSLYSMPHNSTSKVEYIDEVNNITESLRGLPEGKVVAARVKVIPRSLDLAETFFDFCKRFPECFIFCFNTPATGCWIGASPELLLASRGQILTTMALAGTRVCHTEGDWDIKNIEEQRIVADFITRVFSSAGLRPVLGETYTKVTGLIEHICTPISADLPNGLNFDLQALLKKLSPTPALSGNPRNLSFELIKRLENFDRGCYGGFCGPYHSLNDFMFNVILRCGAVSMDRFVLYGGGGITSRSTPEDEWLETEVKLRNILPE